MAKKQIVRLTEGDLHRIIKESVEQILAEGQGWDTFKRGLTKPLDGGDDADNEEDLDATTNIKNFVNKGDVNGKNLRYYHKDEPLHSTTYKDGAKEIDRSTIGKVGRAAGLAAGMGAYGARLGAEKIKNGVSNMRDKMRKK